MVQQCINSITSAYWKIDVGTFAFSFECWLLPLEAQGKLQFQSWPFLNILSKIDVTLHKILVASITDELNHRIFICSKHITHCQSHKYYFVFKKKEPVATKMQNVNAICPVQHSLFEYSRKINVKKKVQHNAWVKNSENREKGLSKVWLWKTWLYTKTTWLSDRKVNNSWYSAGSIFWHIFEHISSINHCRKSRIIVRPEVWIQRGALHSKHLLQ